jgi:predicted sulfurtransferase
VREGQFSRLSLRIAFMRDAKEKDAGSNDLEVLCRHCGHALSKFLHQMEEHNAEVVCPSCGTKHDGDNPSQRTGASSKHANAPEKNGKAEQTGKPGAI